MVYKNHAYQYNSTQTYTSAGALNLFTGWN